MSGTWCQDVKSSQSTLKLDTKAAFQQIQLIAIQGSASHEHLHQRKFKEITQPAAEFTCGGICGVPLTRTMRPDDAKQLFA